MNLILKSTLMNDKKKKKQFLHILETTLISKAT